MPSEPSTSAITAAPEAVLDTCCLVNLAAVDGTLDCLATFDLTWYVPTAVQAEGVFIRTAADSRVVRRIDLAAALSAGTVQICAPAGDAEHALYVEFALGLDDGEAMALAIAKSRGWKLATDDRKARNKASAVGVIVLTTPELLPRWASRVGFTNAQVSEVLRRIESLARFVPPDNAPAVEWWRRILAENPEA